MINIDWDDFAEKLVEELGESLIEDDEDESDPFNWWLRDVTVEDITDFVKNYYQKQFNKKLTEDILKLSNKIQNSPKADKIIIHENTIQNVMEIHKCTHEEAVVVLENLFDPNKYRSDGETNL